MLLLVPSLVPVRDSVLEVGEESAEVGLRRLGRGDPGIRKDHRRLANAGTGPKPFTSLRRQSVHDHRVIRPLNESSKLLDHFPSILSQQI